jgi:hypothetical protein
VTYKGDSMNKITRLDVYKAPNVKAMPSKKKWKEMERNYK